MDDISPILPFTSKQTSNKRYNNHTNVLYKHPHLKILIETTGHLKYKIPIWSTINDAVLYAVIGQMLSNAASSSIIKRLLEKFKTSNAVIEWAEETWRKKGPIYGVSQRKRRALKEWAVYSKNNNRSWQRWKSIPLKQYRDEINTVWGFGRWSADMIAIFYLGRMDVWPETDNGIQKISSLIFKTNKSSIIKKHIAGCETITALYMWELINQKLVSDIKKVLNNG